MSKARKIAEAVAHALHDGFGHVFILDEIYTIEKAVEAELATHNAEVRGKALEEALDEVCDSPCCCERKITALREQEPLTPKS